MFDGFVYVIVTLFGRMFVLWDFLYVRFADCGCNYSLLRTLCCLFLLGSFKGAGVYERVGYAICRWFKLLLDLLFGDVWCAVWVCKVAILFFVVVLVTHRIWSEMDGLFGCFGAAELGLCGFEMVVFCFGGVLLLFWFHGYWRCWFARWIYIGVVDFVF